MLSISRSWQLGLDQGDREQAILSPRAVNRRVIQLSQAEKVRLRFWMHSVLKSLKIFLLGLFSRLLFARSCSIV